MMQKKGRKPSALQKMSIKKYTPKVSNVSKVLGSILSVENAMGPPKGFVIDFKTCDKQGDPREFPSQSLLSLYLIPT